LLDTLGEKAGDIVTQISTVSLRLGKLLDDKNVQNLSRTLDNLATASDGLREMPAILASVREALSDTNLRSLRQILAHVEKTAGESAPLATRDARTGKDHERPFASFRPPGGGRRRGTATVTLPQANAADA
jgi:ABC-type transporter Mla subunit MlaD